MLILVILFYLSNPRNKVNQWCTIAGLFFWLGIIKEAILYDIIPVVSFAFGWENLEVSYIPVHSILTWIIYNFATPAMAIAAFHMGDNNSVRPKYTPYLKLAMFSAVPFLLIFFNPLRFHEYQFYDKAFWLTFTIYNFFFSFAVAYFVIRNTVIETNKSLKLQKKQVGLILLPPLYFWLFTIFIVNLFEFNNLIDLWMVNLFIVLVCLVIIIKQSFQVGFMGLKLVGQNYDWNTNMKLANLSAEFTSHFLKNQISKMELCVDNIATDYFEPGSGVEVPEEVTILCNSISSLKSYSNKIMQHSQNIRLHEGSYRIYDLLTDALTASLFKRPDIIRYINIDEGIYAVCDKDHMTEVFVNIITNAAEAMGGKGILTISEEYEKSSYRLFIKDNGSGIDAVLQEKVFSPYFSTKNKVVNFGLGLAYCKNVVVKHGGQITMSSQKGKGATVTITLPSRRISYKGAGRSGAHMAQREGLSKAGGHNG